MGILSRFRHKETKEEVGLARSQLIADANTVLEILRNSFSGFNSCMWGEVAQKFYARRGISEERLVRALKILCQAELIGWNDVGSPVNFNRMHLPLKLPILVI